MKRFFLFGGNQYYPSGGASDFIKDFDTLEEVDEFIKNYDDMYCDWFNILDTETGKTGEMVE